MNRFTLPALLASVASLVTSPPVQGARFSEPAASPPICVEVRAEVRYGALAYDHIVHLTNVCDRTQVCTVSTDVNPDPIDVTVPGHREVEVVTFRGSPAREFLPRVVCHPE